MAISKPVALYETISGALTKINKKSQHADDQRMILATHRTAATQSKHCSRVYIRTLENITRTTPVSERELAARGRFAAVSAAVKARKADLMNLSNDQAAWMAQKDQPNGKKTFRAYLWYVCGQAYDQAHGE